MIMIGWSTNHLSYHISLWSRLVNLINFFHPIHQMVLRNSIFEKNLRCPLWYHHLIHLGEVIEKLMCLPTNDMKWQMVDDHITKYPSHLIFYQSIHFIEAIRGEFKTIRRLKWDFLVGCLVGWLVGW